LGGWLTWPRLASASVVVVGVVASSLASVLPNASAEVPTAAVVLASQAPAAQRAESAQLTGLFSVTLRGTSPKSARSQHFELGWSFTAECATGACSVQVSTTANSCVSGTCAQPPSPFAYTHEQLALVKGRYNGQFVVAVGCYTNASGTYWPTAYSQRTWLNIAPSATAVVGSIGSTSLRQVSAISGQLRVAGSPTAIGRKEGCGPYATTYSVSGRAQQG
jgi:hypothetical protein